MTTLRLRTATFQEGLALYQNFGFEIYAEFSASYPRTEYPKNPKHTEHISEYFLRKYLQGVDEA